MALRSSEWWLQGCVLSLEGCCLAPLELVGWWVATLFGGIVIKFIFLTNETKTINFMVSMDMIVTSMDFKY